MNCKFWSALSWMFLGTVVLFSVYVGQHFHCWSGVIITLAGAVGGYAYARYKRHTNSTKYLYRKYCGKEFHLEKDNYGSK